MPKKVRDYGVPNTENPEWNAKEMATAKRFNDLPEDFAALSGQGQTRPAEGSYEDLGFYPLIARCGRGSARKGKRLADGR